MQAFRLVAEAGRHSGKPTMIDFEAARANRAKHDEVLIFVDVLGYDTTLDSLRETYNRVRT